MFLAIVRRAPRSIRALNPTSDRGERGHFRITPSGRVVMHDGEPVPDDGPAIQAIAHLLRVQERKARLMGLDAPTQRAVDVVSHEVFVGAVAELEAEVAALEVEAVRCESEDS